MNGMPEEVNPRMSLHNYEDRYRMVFAAGALYWNDPRPNHHLAQTLHHLPVPSRCVEFGCGEGYQSYLMASRGHSVTAMDLSPTAISKAIKNTPDSIHIDFVVGDVTEGSSMNIPSDSFDLAVDIGCLHMMVEDEDRSQYLEFVYEVLKKGGIFYVQNGLDLDDVIPQHEDERRRVSLLRQYHESTSPLVRKIVTATGMKEITLPLCPASMMRLEDYIKELEIHRFHIVSSDRIPGSNVPYETLVIAKKI